MFFDCKFTSDANYYFCRANCIQHLDSAVYVMSVCLSVRLLHAGIVSNCSIKKSKVFPYSLPSVGPGADPGVQAVSPQVT